MEKSGRKLHQKLVPDPFLIWVSKSTQLLDAISSFKIKCFERGLSKSLNKVNFFFLFQTQLCIIWPSLTIFELLQKFANFCKPIHHIINHSTSICPFEYGKCEKEGRVTKNEYPQNKKSFFNETKKHFL